MKVAQIQIQCGFHSTASVDLCECWCFYLFQALDEERVASHLNDLLKRVQMKTFNSDTDSAEVICVLFEVRLRAHLKCVFSHFLEAEYQSCCLGCCVMNVVHYVLWVCMAAGAHVPILARRCRSQ